MFMWFEEVSSLNMFVRVSGHASFVETGSTINDHVLGFASCDLCVDVSEFF